MRFKLTFLINFYMITGSTSFGPVDLDAKGRFKLNWYLEEDDITFDVTVRTLGWVGFGISPHGKMQGADIFIAGVNDDGTPYSSDRFGTFGLTNTLPKKDSHSDWNLLKYSEENGKTDLKFTRQLDTCDEEDYPIKNGTNRIIWAMGLTDKIKFHLSTERGSKSVILLAANDVPFIKRDPLKTYWVTSSRRQFNVTVMMPTEETSFWCSFHRGPWSNKKSFITGFNPILPYYYQWIPLYVHHITLYKCDLDKKPKETVMSFQNFTVETGFPGYGCYERHAQVNEMFHSCREHLYTWATGGEKFRFPDDIGYPIQPDAGRFQYFMIQIHLENEDRMPSIEIKTGVEIFYTNEHKEHEPSMLLVGYDFGKSADVVIPPSTKDFVVVGHCSPECTNAFPDDGITVFGSLFHSHKAGRKFKLRHFRNGTELEWLDVEENFDFYLQQTKMLMYPRKVMRGDQLTLECTYDTRNAKRGKTIMGGVSSQEEMCQVYLYYYPKIDLEVCSSTYGIPIGLLELGISEYNQIVGERRSKKSSRKVQDSIDRLQSVWRYDKHSGICMYKKPNRGPSHYIPRIDDISYPKSSNFQAYVPPTTCSAMGEANDSTYANISSHHKPNTKIYSDLEYESIQETSLNTSKGRVEVLSNTSTERTSTSTMEGLNNSYASTQDTTTRPEKIPKTKSNSGKSFWLVVLLGLAILSTIYWISIRCKRKRTNSRKPASCYSRAGEVQPLREEIPKND